MNEILLGHILPNLIYKRLLDMVNEDPIRKLILDRFHDKFDYVWLTLYGDVVVSVEIEGEAIFIIKSKEDPVQWILGGDEFRPINKERLF